jgi:hypothetical protein
MSETSDIAGAIPEGAQERRKVNGTVTLTEADLQKLVAEVGEAAAKAYTRRAEVPPLSPEERKLVRRMMEWFSHQDTIATNKIALQEKRLELFKKALPSALGGLGLLAAVQFWERLSAWWLAHFRWI